MIAARVVTIQSIPYCYIPHPSQGSFAAIFLEGLFGLVQFTSLAVQPAEMVICYEIDMEESLEQIS